VCGDFNGGAECGAVQYLERGSIGPDFLEDGDQVSSKEKVLPFSPLTDVLSADCIDRGGAPPPATLVVPELISHLIEGGKVETAYEEPHLSQGVLDRLHRIYSKFATFRISDVSSDLLPLMYMGKKDVERWLTIINLHVGRGTEFRNAAKCMGWVEPKDIPFESEEDNKIERPPIHIPVDGFLSVDDFVGVYLDELRQGKFWGIAWDLAALGEPLPISGVFRARYDRMYASQSLTTAVVLDTLSDNACPNRYEPSDHLPICASFRPRESRE
jgi:hypothetical protein